MNVPEKEKDPTVYTLDQVTIRMVRDHPLISDKPVDTPAKAVDLLHEILRDSDREIFAVINFQTDLKPINLNIVSIGTLNTVCAHPREILKSVVLSNSSAVMLIHNHPSGNISPSPEDYDITRRMSTLLNVMDVRLLDHIILGPQDNYYSFKENDVF